MQQCEVANINSACVMVHDKKDCRNLFPEICQHCTASDHGLRTSIGGINQRNLKCLGWTWQKNMLRLGCNSRPCFVCHFLIMHPSSVTQTKGFLYHQFSYLSLVLKFEWHIISSPRGQVRPTHGPDSRGRTVGTGESEHCKYLQGTTGCP
jgi:hypothetical protein